MTAAAGADAPPPSSETDEEANVDLGEVYDDDEAPGRARPQPHDESAQDDWRADLPSEETP